MGEAQTPLRVGGARPRRDPSGQIQGVSVARLCLFRSYGVYAAPILVLFEVANLMSRNRVWSTEFEWAISWSGLSVALAGPVLAGLAGFESRRLVLSTADSVRTLLGGGLRLHASRVGALWAWAGTIHLLATATAAGLALQAGAPPTSPASNWLLPVLAVLAAFAAWIALGALVGWVSPHLLSILAVVVVSIGLNIGLFPVSPLTLIRFGGSTSSILGLEWRLDVVGTQFVWAAALTVGFVAAMVLRPGERTGRPLVLLAALVATAAAIQLIAAGGNALRPAPQPVAQVCQGVNPTVCVTPPRRSQLHALRSLYSQLEVVVASTPQIVLPARIEQATPRDPPGRFGQELQRIPLPNPREVVGIEDTARQLVLTTAGCPDDVPIEQYMPGVELASTITDWMLASAEPPLGRLSGAIGAPPTEDQAKESWALLASCDWANLA